MSFDSDGFTEVVSGGVVSIVVDPDHRLIKLAQKLPWEEMLELILSDLQCAEKKHWWRGRPLRIRIHLGIYVLQQMFDLRTGWLNSKCEIMRLFACSVVMGCLRNGMRQTILR